MAKRIKPAKPLDSNDTEKSREQLMAELEYLRMENAVLKELKALREERSEHGRKSPDCLATQTQISVTRPPEAS